MQQKYLGGQFARSAVESNIGVNTPVPFSVDRGDLASRHQEQQCRIENIKEDAVKATPNALAAKSGASRRAPSPATQLLQNRLRKAQEAFSQLANS